MLIFFLSKKPQLLNIFRYAWTVSYTWELNISLYQLIYINWSGWHFEATIHAEIIASVAPSRDPIVKKKIHPPAVQWR